MRSPSCLTIPACCFIAALGFLQLDILCAQDEPAGTVSQRDLDLIRLLNQQAWNNLEKGFALPAQNAFEAILEKDSGHADAHVGLAVSLFLQKKTNESLNSLSKAGTADPDNKRLAEWRTKILDAVTAAASKDLNADNASENAKAFEAVLEQDSQHQSARLGLAVALFLQKQHQRALDEFDTVWGRNPGNRQLLDWRRKLVSALMADETRHIAGSYLRLKYQQDRHDTFVVFWLGRVALADRQPCTAIRWFQLARRQTPDYPDLDVWLGTAWLQSERPLAALRIFRCARPQTKEGRGILLVQRAAAEASLGLRGSAFHNLRYAFDTPAEKNARTSIARLNEAVCENEWAGSFRYALRYDDNPAVLPDINVFGQTGLVPVPTAGHAINGRVIRTLFGDTDEQVTLGASLNQTLNNELSAADISQPGIDVTYVRRWMNDEGDVWNAGFSTNYDYLWFGASDLVGRWGLTPSLSIQTDDFTTWNLYGRFLTSNFSQGAAEGTARDLDSENLAAGVGLLRQSPDRNLSFQLTYQCDWNFADGNDFDYHGHRLTSGIGWKTPVEGLQLGLQAVTYFRSYESTDTIFGVRRDDEEFLVNATASYELREDLNLVFSWNFDRNDSTVIPSDYRRNIWDLGLQWRF